MPSRLNFIEKNGTLDTGGHAILRAQNAEAVRDRAPIAIGVHAGLGRQDVLAGNLIKEAQAVKNSGNLAGSVSMIGAASC